MLGAPDRAETFLVLQGIGEYDFVPLTQRSSLPFAPITVRSIWPQPRRSLGE
jgi:hypothetical protein